MKEDLIEPARIRTIQESLCGFLLDEVINPKGEFYSNQRISVARTNPKKCGTGDDWNYLRICQKKLIESDLGR